MNNCNPDWSENCWGAEQTEGAPGSKLRAVKKLKTPSWDNATTIGIGPTLKLSSKCNKQRKNDVIK